MAREAEALGSESTLDKRNIAISIDKSSTQRRCSPQFALFPLRRAWVEWQRWQQVLHLREAAVRVID